MNYWKDVGLRAFKTAIQSGLAVLTATGLGWVHPTSLKAAGIAGIAAGLSALQNAISGSEPPIASPTGKPPA